MSRQLATALCFVVFGMMTLSSHAIAQQKTSAACKEEWRANKAANKANGITEKAYVAQCRGGTTPAQTTAAPVAPSTPVPTPTAAANGQKTAKACQAEWRANKAANQANGVTEKAYVAQCRGGATPAQTTAAPAPTAAPAGPAPAPTASAPPAKTLPAPSSPATTAKPTGANEFSSEAQAKARCPSDTVVWVNLTSKIYHFSGTRFYGTTEHGAYMCERDSTAAGMRSAKNEKHP